jgi:NADH-quinone oxidoreductase subunit M
MTNYLLSLILFVPLLVAVGLLLVPSNKVGIFRYATLAAFAVQLVLALVAWCSFDGNHTPDSWDNAFQLVERASWIRMDVPGMGSFVVDYFVGVDGLAMPLVVLSSLVLLIGVISSWTIKEKIKGYFILYLVMGVSVVGCFMALDFFLFYLFFELMLLPMFFLIGIWGGPNRQYASVKFFIYTLVGSLLILVAMVVLFLSVNEGGVSTFSLVRMMDASSFNADGILSANDLIFGIAARTWAFWFLFIGFIIKLPAVPMHTWLPDAHVEAPTAISVVLAGLLLKVGGFGLFRIVFPIFPQEAMDAGLWVAGFGVLAILYGGMNALAQNDVKRMVAYSSVSHMGFVLVGIASLNVQGISGGIFQMVSHGLLSPALFLLAGVIYDRTGDRQIGNFSGLASQLPKFTFFTGLFFFASLGLPGMSGFVGELLVLLGAFGASANHSAWIGPLATLGILVSAAYFIWTLQRMFFGKYWVRKPEWQPAMTDLTLREWLMLAPLAVLTLVLGIFPSVVLNKMAASVEFWVSVFSALQK